MDGGDALLRPPGEGEEEADELLRDVATVVDQPNEAVLYPGTCPTAVGTRFLLRSRIAHACPQSMPSP